MVPAPAAPSRGVPLALNVTTLSLEDISPAPRARAASGGGRVAAAPSGRSSGRLPRGGPPGPAACASRPAAACQVEFEVLEALALPPAAAATQTDAAPLAPAVPVEAPMGADAATQVNPDELFDWHRDAAPAVETLVTQALAAAALEAGEALRLEALQRRRRELEEQYREAASLLRLEEDARRRAVERAARQREAEALAASQPREAFHLMGEDDLAEMALATVLSTLGTLCAVTLTAGCSSSSGGAVGGEHASRGSERSEAGRLE